MLDWMKHDDRIILLQEVDEKTGKLMTKYTVADDPKEEDWEPKRMTLMINKTSDLWNVMYKSKYAYFAIPKYGYVEYPNRVKHASDALYNHISNTLQQFRESPTTMHHEVVQNLQKALDVEQPYEIIVDDKSGISRLVIFLLLYIYI